MGIGQQMHPALPSCGFIAPDAPGTLPFGPEFTRQWFPLTNLSAEELDKGVQSARPLLLLY